MLLFCFETSSVSQNQFFDLVILSVFFLPSLWIPDIELVASSSL